MTVEYYADETGYHPTITYQGEAQVFETERQLNQGVTGAGQQVNLQGSVNFQDQNQNFLLSNLLESQRLNSGLQGLQSIQNPQENFPAIQDQSGNFVGTQGQFVHDQTQFNDFQAPQGQFINSQELSGELLGIQGQFNDNQAQSGGLFIGNQGVGGQNIFQKLPLSTANRNFQESRGTTISRPTVTFPQVTVTPQTFTPGSIISTTDLSASTPAPVSSFGSRNRVSVGVPLPGFEIQTAARDQTIGQSQLQQFTGVSSQQPQHFQFSEQQPAFQFSTPRPIVTLSPQNTILTGQSQTLFQPSTQLSNLPRAQQQSTLNQDRTVQLPIQVYVTPNEQITAPLFQQTSNFQPANQQFGQAAATLFQGRGTETFPQNLQQHISHIGNLENQGFQFGQLTGQQQQTSNLDLQQGRGGSVSPSSRIPEAPSQLYGLPQ